MPDHVELEKFAVFAGLCERERARMAAFRFRADALGFVAAHGVLRLALAALTGIAPTDIRFTFGRFGKPALFSPAAGGIADPAFNISHCRKLAAIAISDQPVGIDVEYLREIDDALAIARDNFPVEHLADIRASPEQRHAQAFLRYWCLSEAVSKASGMGLNMCLKDVAFSSSDPARLIRAGSGIGGPSEWRVSAMIRNVVSGVQFVP